MLLPATATFSQEFAPVGAIWHYTQSNPFQGDGWTFETMESVIDTSIENVKCKKIINIIRNDADTFIQVNKYFYKNNDSVFFYEDGSFNLLYDFGAETGDTITLSYFPTYDGSPLKMIIDSVGIIIINGNDRKIQYITCGDGILVEFGNEIIEDIGSTHNMFPVYDGTLNGPLRCYEDSITGQYLSGFHPDYGWNFKDCAEIITRINEVKDYDGIFLYPNPASSSITVKNVDLPKNFKIINIFGQVMNEGQLMTSRTIYLTGVANGVYYLILHEGSYQEEYQQDNRYKFIICH